MFKLVGITGEDDLDAPDLKEPETDKLKITSKRRRRRALRQNSFSSAGPYKCPCTELEY